MGSSAVSHATYVVLGASGNTGSIITNFLLSKGQRVRVVGRDPGRLQRFVRQGAELFTPTSFELFVKDVFAPPYHGQAFAA
jgi:uncharacterized protein YbjT (DUF2867 family)